MVEVKQSVGEGIGTFLSFSAKSVRPEILEQLLIGRRELAANLEEWASNIANKGMNKQVLLVGPRGSGKTHLLRVLYQRIQGLIKDNKLAVAYFTEDEYGIDSYLDFLIRIIKAFIRWDGELAIHLKSELEQLRDTISVNQVTAAESIILDYVQDRPLLILAENLNDIFAAMKKAGQSKLRSLVLKNNRISIIATTQELSEDLQKEDMPFHNFFSIIRLKPLNFEETVQLIITLATIEKEDRLIAELSTPNGRAKIKAIYRFIKGNHRLLITFYEFLKADALADLSKTFLKTINDLKPYYETFIRYLPPQQQKIIHYLCLAHIPRKGSEIVRDCFIPTTSVSKQMSELQRLGFVDGIEDPNSKRDKFYDIKEPLLRICIEVSEQREGVIGLFVNFLAAYYSNHELRKQKEVFELLASSARENDAKRRKYLFEIEARQEAIALQQLLNKEIESRNNASVLNILTSELKISLERNEYGKAIKVINQLSNENTGFTFRKLLGFCHYQLRDYKKAISYLSASLNDNPNSMSALSLIAMCYRDKGELREAKKYYEKLIEIGSKDTRANTRLVTTYAELGNIYVDFDDFKTATELYGKSLDLEKKNPAAYVGLGIIRMKQGEYRLALEYYEKAEQFDPSAESILRNIAQCYLALNEVTQAADYYLRVYEVNKQSEDVLVSLAAILLKYDPNKAIELCQMAIFINPESTFAYNNMGLAYYLVENLDAAAISFQKLLKLAPNDDGGHNSLGLVYLKQEKYKEAAKCFEKAISLNSKKPSYYQSLYKFHIKQQDKANARKTLSNAFKAVPPVAFIFLLVDCKQQELIEILTYLGTITIDQEKPIDLMDTMIAGALFWGNENSEKQLSEFKLLLEKEVSQYLEKSQMFELIDVFIKYHFHNDKQALLQLPKEKRDFFLEEIIVKRQEADRLEQEKAAILEMINKIFP